jgi:hypothetical protein
VATPQPAHQNCSSRYALSCAEPPAPVTLAHPGSPRGGAGETLERPLASRNRTSCIPGATKQSLRNAPCAWKQTHEGNGARYLVKEVFARGIDVRAGRALCAIRRLVNVVTGHVNRLVSWCACCVPGIRERILHPTRDWAARSAQRRQSACFVRTRSRAHSCVHFFLNCARRCAALMAAVS